MYLVLFEICYFYLLITYVIGIPSNDDYILRKLDKISKFKYYAREFMAVIAVPVAILCLAFLAILILQSKTTFVFIIVNLVCAVIAVILRRYYR